MPLVGYRAVLTGGVDYDDGAGAADALMTLHGDRPTETKSGSNSPVNASSVAGAKRPASPKQESLEAVKKAKNESSSPARRTVIEVLNTPSVDSPVPKVDSSNGNGGDEYFKGTTEKKGLSSPGVAKSAVEKASEEAPKETTGAPALTESGEESTETAKAPARPETPPIEAPAPSTEAPAGNEDVTMAEPDVAAPAAANGAEPTTAPAAEADPTSTESTEPAKPAEAEAEAAADTNGDQALKPESGAPSVSAEVPAPAEAEKKDE